MKATHIGTCQICSKYQKLPNGNLSKHGYTVDFGFFMGTCKGAGSAPFEISCELLKSELARAEIHIEEETIRIKDFNAQDTSGITKAMITVRTDGFGRPRKLVDATLREDLENHMVYADYETFHGKKTVALVQTACYPHTVQGHVDSSRLSQQAEWKHNLTGVRTWMYQAQKRVEDWELKELTEI